MLAVYRKVTKFATVINFFSSHEWEFRNNNVRKLWEKCNSRDQELFKFNMKTFDWEAYFFYHIRGIRMYLLNDPLDTVEEALIKNRKCVSDRKIIINSLIMFKPIKYNWFAFQIVLPSLHVSNYIVAIRFMDYCIFRIIFMVSVPFGRLTVNNISCVFFPSTRCITTLLSGETNSVCCQ